jgi:predicted transcriptional regulator
MSGHVTIVLSTAPMLLSATKTRKYYTGVSLDREVTAYLDEIAERMGWSRSITLNYIVREYASRKGDDIVLPRIRKMLAEKKGG